uniref:Putative secreted protein n=1 Tax=Anopheles marajoara TaxID=58244 RepID=A0A2M4CDB8_9DIPT
MAMSRHKSCSSFVVTFASLSAFSSPPFDLRSIPLLRESCVWGRRARNTSSRIALGKTTSFFTPHQTDSVRCRR